jgi:hypothetical protein
MKKLIIEEEIKTVHYKDCNSNNLIIGIFKDYTLLLKQISESNWMWIDMLSSGALGEGSVISYTSSHDAILNLIKKGYSIFEFKNWNEYIENF